MNAYRRFTETTQGHDKTVPIKISLLAELLDGTFDAAEREAVTDMYVELLKKLAHKDSP